jgi:hypothetical protein
MKRASLSNSMRPEHKRMSRMLGFCLMLDTPEAWAGFSFVAAVRLTPAERAQLASAVLAALRPDLAEEVASASLGAAGRPLPSFLGGMEDARFWRPWHPDVN